MLYFARVKAGSLKEKKFRQWQYEAVRKRDACLQGTMPLGKFKDWSEVSMPNHVKKRNKKPPERSLSSGFDDYGV